MGRKRVFVVNTSKQQAQARRLLTQPIRHKQTSKLDSLMTRCVHMTAYYHWFSSCIRSEALLGACGSGIQEAQLATQTPGPQYPLSQRYQLICLFWTTLLREHFLFK